MTFDEMVALQGVKRRKPRELEHKLQCQLVKWFRLQYPHLKHALFSVPNGGKRDKVTAAKMKEEGQLSGVSDLILLVNNGQYGALLIEVKTKDGCQSDNQKEWQRAIEKGGYKYVIVRSLEEFMDVIKEYIDGKGRKDRNGKM